MPPLGYWARVAAGKKTPTPPLPKYSGPAEIVKKYGRTYLPNRYSYQPTGALKLGIIGSHYEELQKVVADGKHQRVEQCLNEFVEAPSI